MNMISSNSTAIAARQIRAANGARIVAGRLRKVWRTMQLTLAKTGSGRIALHVMVALKTGHYAWHLQGIGREFIRN